MGARSLVPALLYLELQRSYLYILKFPPSKFCFAFPQQETFLHFENLSAFQRTKKTLFVWGDRAKILKRANNTVVCQEYKKTRAHGLLYSNHDLYNV